MKDVEDDTRPSLIENPYSAAGNPHELGPYHPVNLLYRIGVMGGSLYFLHYWEVYSTVLRSPKVGHEWFKIGLAASIGTFEDDDDDDR